MRPPTFYDSTTRSRVYEATGEPASSALLLEGVRSAAAQRLSTLTTALVIGVVCFVVLTTTGQSAAAERSVMERIDDLGTRLVTAVDRTGQAHMRADSVEAVGALSTVDWSFALGGVSDVTNAHGPEGRAGVALRPHFGDFPPDLRILTGRLPRSGEAMVGRDGALALGLGDGVGAVTDGTMAWPVVGTFHTSGPLAQLNSVVLVSTPHFTDQVHLPAPEARYVYAMAASTGVVGDLTAELPSVVSAQVPGGVEVDTPEGAIALREVIAGDMGAASRRSMVLVLTVGLALVCISTVGAVGTRRRDFGRMRALGASRSALVVMTLIQVAVSSVVGVVGGTIVGLAVVANIAPSLPSWSFCTGVAVLCLLIAVAGATPPAMAAAFRDPVRILRVP